MSSYNDDNRYLDGEERRPKLIHLLMFIILVVIVLVIIISCGMRKDNSGVSKKKSSNNSYLSSIRLTNAKLSPAFTKNVYSYDAEVESDEVIITCAVEDSSSKLVGCNEKVKLTGDTTKYEIKVTNGSSTSTYVVNFKKNSKADASKTTVSSVKSQDGKSYILTASVDPAIKDVNYKWFKDNKEIPNSNSSSYTVSESGKYYVNISTKDLLTSINSEPVEITIVKETKETKETTSTGYTLKINSIKGNSSSWTTSVTLTVDATSSNGLDSNAYSFDGGKTYQQSNKKTFTYNQTVVVIVKDKKGNTAKDSIVISKIDNTNPKASISTSSEKASEITLTAKVNPGSTSSGYKYQWYKNGDAISNATSSTYKATSSGRYKVKVTTGSGNSTVSDEYYYLTTQEKCPRLTALTKDKKAVAPRTWINEDVYIKVVPPTGIGKFDIYVNKSGVYDQVSNEFIFYKTFDKSVAIKLSAGGLRYIKIVSYDKYGNSHICYSDIYFINK